MRVKHNEKFTSVLKLGPVISCCCGSLSYLSEDALSRHYFFSFPQAHCVIIAIDPFKESPEASVGSALKIISFDEP